MRYIDAHNHLQDDRFGPKRLQVTEESRSAGVVWSAVNGACPDDWPAVAALAEWFSWVLPNFGVHPWYIKDLPTDWESTLLHFLDKIPSGIGETGIDGWRKEFNAAEQERIFVRQLAIASERNLPISIHGLRRWGRLLEILKNSARPDCGFVLHSYGGPVEMISAFSKLGGYFSCPGFFLKPGREMKLSVFKSVPPERLLIETDAPDQNLPENLDRYKLTSKTDGVRINHPGNIGAVYSGLAEFIGIPLEELCLNVEANFCRLFKPVIDARRRDIPCGSR